MAPKFSVIIPTLNEAEPLGRLIGALKASARNDFEVVVSDGGSDDGTDQVALQMGARLATGQRGRGAQLNRGAAFAAGEILAFLHADTLPPPHFFASLDKAFADHATEAVSFRVRFDPPHPLLRFPSWWSRFDTSITRYGDQGLVLRRQLFENSGGYPDWPLFEDVELFRRLRERTLIRVLPDYLTTSSRRFLATGVLKRQLRNMALMVRFLLGTSPFKLAQTYSGTHDAPSKAALIIFARFPEPGKVKTRLARDLGTVAAAEVYRGLAEKTFKTAAQCSKICWPYLFYSEAGDADRIRDWAGPSFYYVSQEEGDLGRRMKSAFDTVFSYGHNKAVIIGTDAPGLSEDHISAALKILETKDTAFGPAKDGGFYLAAMAKTHAGIFEGIPWSTPEVLDATLARCTAAKLKWELLPPLLDIDTADDLKEAGLAFPQLVAT